MRVIVFDWDGTLVDTLPAILQANIEVLREYGVPFDESVYRSAYVPDWRHMYRRLGVPEAAVEAAGARWLELYRAASELAPFAGVGDALRRLAAAGYRMGLVTAGDRPIVEQQLARFGLADLLPVRICGDDPLPPKPDPEPLLEALRLLDVRSLRREPVYVGDAPDDMRMARAVGIRGVGVVGPLASAEDLLAAGASETTASVVEWVDVYLGRRTATPRRAGDRTVTIGEP